MKQRKLFAILTLVAFMMTLLPMAAFANFGQSDFSAAASYTTLDKDRVRVGQEATITLTTRTNTGALIYNPHSQNDLEFWVKATRDAETYKIQAQGQVVVSSNDTSLDLTGDDAHKVSSTDAAEMLEPEGMKVVAKPDANGEIKIKLSSTVAGKVTVGLYKDVTGDGAKDGLLIGQETVEFTASASSVDRVAITAIEHTDRGDSAVKDSTSDEPQVGRELTIKARVADDQNNGIANQEVLFQKRFDGGSWSTFATKNTNSLGRAEAKFIGNDAGQYDFRIRVGSRNSDPVQTVTYVAGEPATITAAAATRTLEAKASEQYIRFVVKDALGNISLNPAHIDSVEYIKAPADSAYEAGDVITGTIRPRPNKDELEVPVVFDEPGDYVVRAYVNSGIFADVTVKAREKGDIVSIKVEFQDDEKSSLRAHDETSDTLVIDVKEIDTNGISFTSSNADDFVFATSSRALATVSGFTVSGPGSNKDARGVATITVTHKELGYTATIDIPVVGGPAKIDYEVDYRNAKSAVVKLQFVDANGNVTYHADDADTNFTVVNVPAGVNVTNQEQFARKTGKGEFRVTVADYGTYNLTLVAANNLAVTVPVTFGVPAEEKPVFGAKNVTLFIGSTGAVVDGAAKILDVAPFIKDNRTFVPVRFVAEALGAEVKFDAATQVVTATRGDDVIVLTIGSNVFTVNGEAQVTDVAPFIAEGNRTVLPFRAIAEAFGAEVEAGFAADGTTSHVVFRQ